jgi:hypothetical protein
MPTDRETNQGRGLEFVTMASTPEAIHAVTKHNGAMLDERSIKVNEVQERPGGRGGGGRGLRGGGRSGGGFRSGGGGNDRYRALLVPDPQRGAHRVDGPGRRVLETLRELILNGVLRGREYERAWLGKSACRADCNGGKRRRPCDLCIGCMPRSRP